MQTEETAPQVVADESVPPPPQSREDQVSNDVVDPGASSEASAESQSQAGHQMPDPSTLVAMAAMHMPTADLIHVLVTVFDAHAWRSMGLVADHSGEIRKDMPAAQTSIDCLAFLLGKIEGTLDAAEKRDVQRRLMDLRMNYVEKMREG